jgi:hypothetical protein
LGRDGPDDRAVEAAKIRAECQAQIEEIKASYRAHVEAVDVIDAHPEWWEYVLKHFADRGEVVGTPQQALEARNRMIRDVEEHCDRRLNGLYRRERIVAASDNETADAPRGQLPPAPLRVNTYTFATVERAVRLIENGASRNDVAKETPIDPHDATRVRRMRDGGLLRLNRSGKLVVDPNVLRVGKRYGLRYLNVHEPRWLDPYSVPPPPARGRRD